MTEIVLTVVLALLALNVLVSLVRVVRGPTGRDRLLGVVLSGTTGAAVLLVAATLTGTTALRDTALVVVALATVVVLARVGSDSGIRSESATATDTGARSGGSLGNPEPIGEAARPGGTTAGRPGGTTTSSDVRPPGTQEGVR